MSLTIVGSGSSPMLRRPRSPVKTNRRCAAVLAVIELDQGRAEDVAGVEEGEGHARARSRSASA